MAGRGKRVFAVLAWLLFVAAVSGAEDAPWQRLLRGDDAKKAKELEQQLSAYRSAGQFATAVKPATELLALRERRQGTDHWQTVDARLERAMMQQLAAMPAAAQKEIRAAQKQFAEAGRLEQAGSHDRAATLFSQCLVVARKHWGEQHPETAASLDSVGVCLNHQGQHAAAESLLRQGLAIRRKTLGEQHPHTARSLSDLAAALGAQGKFLDAEMLLRQAVAINRSVYGEKHPQTAASLSDLARSLYPQGRYVEAELPNRQALAIYRKVRGDQHPDTARSLKELATILDAQSMYAEAETLCRKALEIYRQWHGNKHAETVGCLGRLSVILYEQKKYSEAESLCRDTLAIVHETVGEHPDTIACLTNLAADLQAQGKCEEAERFFRQALAMRRNIKGGKSPFIAVMLHNLANCLDDQGRYAEAEPLHRQAALSSAREQGVEHPNTAESLSGLASNLTEQGRDVEAEPLHEQSLFTYRAVLGDQHIKTAAALGELTGNLSRQGRYADAEALIRQALAVSHRVQGEQHPITAPDIHNLASTLLVQRKYAESELLYRQALAIYQKIGGEQHPHSASCLHDLARAVYLQDNYAESERLLRQAAAIRRRLLGEQHAATAASLLDLAVVLDRQGKEEAAAYYRAAVAGFEAARLRVGRRGFERTFAAAPHPLFAYLAAYLARRGQAEEAWRIAESGLARGLLDDLSAGTDQLLETAEQQRARARTARLDRLDQLVLPFLTAHEMSAAEKVRLGELAKEREKLQAELAREAAERLRREVFPLDRIQKQIAADAALVFWIDTGSSHWACILRRTGSPAWVRLPGSGDNGAWNESDDRLPARLRGSLTTGERDWRPLARRLAQQRLDPLAPFLAAKGELPAVGRLIAVPAGRMAGVPLETLTDRYTIGYVPSGTLFARLHEQHRPLSQPSLLALGDPTFTVPARPPVPLPEYGLLLTTVQPDGIAGKAGLRRGDVLLRYGGQKLLALADLKLADSGKPIAAQIWRQGRTLDLRLNPGKLGVVLHLVPAPHVLRLERDFENLLAGRNRDEIKALPGSRYEIRALQSLFPHAEVLLGSDASEQRLDELAAAGRLRNFRVLHLATHAEIHPTAARSALLLARDRLPDPLEQGRLGRKVYDGRLTVAAIASAWQLDADLVTLSACETVLGPHDDGLLGFSQVLLHKGARSLLVSLWKADDTATALLMTRFYENWLGKREGLQKPLPKAEALREAKAWLRQLRRGETTYAHPRYWAAFVLLGDPD